MLNRTVNHNISVSTPINMKNLAFGKARPKLASKDSSKPKPFQFEGYVSLTKRSKRTSPLQFSSKKSRLKLYKPSELSDSNYLNDEIRLSMSRGGMPNE